MPKERLFEDTDEEAERVNEAIARSSNECVLFDLDGVLVDSEPLKAAAHSATVKHFGADVLIHYTKR